jgi:hypothetical protein
MVHLLLDLQQAWVGRTPELLDIGVTDCARQRQSKLPQMSLNELRHDWRRGEPLWRGCWQSFLRGSVLSKAAGC